MSIVPSEIDTRTGLRACPGQAGALRSEVYEFWPSDLLRLSRVAGLPRRTPPPMYPAVTSPRSAAMAFHRDHLTAARRRPTHSTRPRWPRHDRTTRHHRRRRQRGILVRRRQAARQSRCPRAAVMASPGAGQYLVRVVDEQGPRRLTSGARRSLPLTWRTDPDEPRRWSLEAGV